MGTKEDVREKIKIEEIIDTYTTLTPVSSGKWRGLCPFHDEKTPSFYVDSDKGLYHCFGCKASGDVFKFVQDIENISFPQALEKLATLAGIKITSYQNNSKRKDLFDINEIALIYFLQHKNLAIKYLKNRGINEENIEKFKIGFAPDTWDGLIQECLAKGISKENLIKAGLATQNENGRIYDKFRNRIIFPIYDYLGRLRGFGGRVLDNSKPKYLNSPETEIFKKSEILYGLDQAKVNYSKENQQIIITEGYLDVIMMHQFGFNNTTATLGTALTAKHIKILEQIGIKECILMFDHDLAGLNATLSGLNQLANSNMQIKACYLEEKDPAELLSQGKIENLENSIKNAKNEIDYRLEVTMEKYKDKKLILKELLPRMSNLDPLDVKASLMRSKVAEKLDILPNALLSWINSNSKHTISDLQIKGMEKINFSNDYEKELLKQILINPELINEIDTTIDWQNNFIKTLLDQQSKIQNYDSSELIDIFNEEEKKELISLLFENDESRMISRKNKEEVSKNKKEYAYIALKELQIRISIKEIEKEIAELTKEYELTNNNEILKRILILQKSLNIEKQNRARQS